MHYLRLLVFLVVAAGAGALAAQDLPERQHILQLAAEGKEAEALKAASEWTLAHPELPEALLLYATLQENADDITGALDSLDSAYFLTREVEILVRKGNVYMRSGQMDQAQAQFRKALRQKETCVPAHLGLARIMTETQDYLEAAAAARAALAIDPHSIEATVTLGQLSFLSGKYDEARELLERAARQKPEYPSQYLWLGRLYSELGRRAESQKAWRRYLDLAPTDAEAWLLSHNLYPGHAVPYACNGYYPTFARDGKQLAYRGRADQSSVYLSTVEHPEVGERLYESTATIYSIDWSPDSKYLLCRDYIQETVDGKPQYRYRLVVVEARTGGKATVVYEGRYVGQPSWGPDGKTVQFDGFLPGKGRAILSVPLTGGEPTPRVVPQLNESFVGCQWLPDGKRLLLQRWAQVAREYQLLLSDPADRSKDRVLASSPQTLFHVTLSPRGDYVLYYRRLGQPPMWNLMAIALDQNGAAHPLGVRTTQLLPPALTADQKHLLLYSSGLMMHTLEGVGGEG